MKRVSRHILGAALVAGLAAFAPGGDLRAQGTPATLIADDISFDEATRAITARGGVEIYWQGTRLRASAITYSQSGDRITVQGPLTLTDADGTSVLIADFADLTTDLQEGVLQSARLVLDRQLQIAATQIDRSDGRYTQMYQAVASSCEVCFDNPTPLWEIRARRVVHDAEEQQLYFQDAQFRVMGVPVMWLPRMRLPDPTLERATGFLAPSIRADDRTGAQLRLPYFILLGDHADLTVTPWLGTGDSQTFELRYRQAFRRGSVEVTGAVTSDGLTDAALRGFLFADGSFQLGHGFDLEFGLQAVSDDGYLTTYGFPDSDLLESFVRLTRTTADLYVEAGATLYQSLRADDDDGSEPTRLATGEAIYRFEPGLIGGLGEARLSAMGYQRTEDTPGTLADGTPAATDAMRLSGVVDWRRTETLGPGLRLTFETALAADIYAAAQDADPALNGTIARATPYGAIELRWPWQAPGRTPGVQHLIEPVVQVVWSETYGADVPVEDSRIVEFDEANLFALDRFPGSDIREQGARANIGLSYTRTAAEGWRAGVAAGVVLRDSDRGQFTPGSGLDGTQSDWLLAAHLAYDDDLRVMTRALFDQDFVFTSNELTLDWAGARHDLTTSYIWLAADPLEGRPDDVAEWALEAEYTLASAWQAGVNWRYDFAEGGPTRAGLSLGYVNECVDVEFSLSRRYTTSTSLDPATEFGLTVALNGFGATREGRSQTRVCRR